MGIQPIDLQTLFSQLQKVGKIQGEHQHALASQLDKQQEANKADSLQRLVTVQKTAGDDAKSTVINSDGSDAQQQSSEQKKEASHKKDKNEEKQQSNYINDPNLGQKIDLSG